MYYYKVCYDVGELDYFIKNLNRYDYTIVAMTESSEGYYTIIYKR